MFLKALLVLAIGLGAVMCAQVQLTISASAKINRLQQQTELLSSQNPSNAPFCFSYYKPILAEISDKYEADYDACNHAYELSCADIDGAYSDNQVQASARSACNSLYDCYSIVGYVEAFECYAHAGAENSKIMYEISSNATQLAAQYGEQYRAVEAQQTICINNAERNYVQNTTGTYEYLNACLNGDNITTETTTPTTKGTTTTRNMDTTPAWKTTAMRNMLKA